MNYQNAEFVTSAFDSESFLNDGRLDIAFAGRSNVGKSSLMNKIFNKKSLVRTSSTPGKTASVNYFKVGDIYFVDLPGYGFAKVSKEKKNSWGSLIDDYFASGKVDLCVLLLDMRHEPSDDDINMINYLEETEIPYFIVLTKSDKLNKTETEKQLSYFDGLIPDTEKIVFSSLKNIGVDLVRNKINAFIDSH